ncbi:unnamed protein product [Knipowitschia caucasica]
MSEKHRSLPSWMSKKANEKTKEPLKSKRKPKVARSVFYCMNEKELVQAASTYLSNLQNEHKPEPNRVGPVSKQRSLSPAAKDSWDSDKAQDRTYVSESDIDITEVETVPYPVVSTEATKDREGPQCNDERHTQDTSGFSLAATEDEKEAFQLVREIFFT